MESKLKFNIQAESGNARTGHLQLGSRMAYHPMLVQTGMVPAILTSGELTALGTPGHQAVGLRILAQGPGATRATGLPIFMSTCAGRESLLGPLSRPGLPLGQTPWP